jgi:adenosylcobinamide-phosphate synthase
MRSEIILILLLSIVIDRLFGEPPDKWHPTVYMGKTIDVLDRSTSNGTAIFLASSIFFSLLSFFILKAFNGWFELIIAILLLKVTFSWRGLRDYNQPIAKAVEMHDINGARKLLPYIAGRNPEKLGREDIISTSVESIAESSVDGVISPIFYFFIFSFLGLTTGVSAAVFYRVTNTLDSMLGLPENKKGMVSARMDEFLNFLPSRIAALLMLLSTAILGKPSRKGFNVFRRDRNSTKSKNAGQTMSVMAGALGVRLKKESFYSIGDPDVELTPRHIYDALKIVDVQIMLFVGLLVMFWILST